MLARALAGVVGVLLLAQPALGARPIHLRMAASLGCPSEAQVRRSLIERLGQDALTESDGDGDRLDLRASGPGALELELWEVGTPPLRRSLRIDVTQCTSLAETVALIVEAHRRGLSWVAPAAVAEPLPAPANEPLPPAKSQPSRRIARAEVIRSAPAQSQIVASAPARSRELHFDLSLLAGGAIPLRSASVVPGLTLAVEMRLRGRFGVGLSGELEQESTLPYAPGSLSLRRTPLVLFGRLWLGQDRPLALGLGGGVLLDVVSAHSAGFLISASDTLYDPGIWLAATLRWRLPHGLSVLGQGGFDLLFRTDSFDVPFVGPVASTERLWLRLSAGLGYEFF